MPDESTPLGRHINLQDLADKIDMLSCRLDAIEMNQDDQRVVNLVQNFCCCCQQPVTPPPPPPPPQRKKVGSGTLGKGNSIMAISYPFTCSARSDTDVTIARVKVTVDGFQQMATDLPWAVGDPAPVFNVIVPAGAKFSVADSDIDGSGNESTDSVGIEVASAADTTPPAQPGGGTIGKGQTVDDSTLPAYVPVTPVPVPPATGTVVGARPGQPQAAAHRRP